MDFFVLSPPTSLTFLCYLLSFLVSLFITLLSPTPKVSPEFLRLFSHLSRPGPGRLSGTAWHRATRQPGAPSPFLGASPALPVPALGRSEPQIRC